MDDNIFNQLIADKETTYQTIEEFDDRLLEFLTTKWFKYSLKRFFLWFCSLFIVLAILLCLFAFFLIYFAEYENKSMELFAGVAINIKKSLYILVSVVLCSLILALGAISQERRLLRKINDDAGKLKELRCDISDYKNELKKNLKLWKKESYPKM